ncbi:D-isomer specific 2-hydroxyacid dehydrogenase [Dipodascopsis tothii]|uniref:D-isomer specific 2-hydroxyacid dehydrogenase n=1 Tax=Dipodascopsis tothii TaxID=44089 RepID=UPI0034CE1C2C
MSKPVVLLVGSIEHASEEWQQLGDVATLVTCTSANRDEFIADLQGKYSEVVAIFRTFFSIDVTGRYDAELVSHFPPSLKFLCHNGAGYDQIDVDACSAAGVRVSNCPTAVDDGTADANMFLILGAIRNFGQGIFQLRKRQWDRGVDLANDPQGKILGILGMGGIGRTLKQRAEAFGMKTIYHNRRELSPELAAGAKYVSFDELLATSDVLSLNLPLNAGTRHIIDDAAFAKMKDGVIVVNTARGAVMDEDALVRALASGKVRNAGLDVFENEPEIHPGLLDNDKVVLIPHMGTSTYETQKKMELEAIGNVRAAITRGQLNTIVAEQVGMQ